MEKERSRQLEMEKERLRQLEMEKENAREQRFASELAKLRAEADTQIQSLKMQILAVTQAASVIPPTNAALAINGNAQIFSVEECSPCDASDVSVLSDSALGMLPLQMPALTLALPSDQDFELQPSKDKAYTPATANRSFVRAGALVGNADAFSDTSGRTPRPPSPVPDVFGGQQDDTLSGNDIHDVANTVGAANRMTVAFESISLKNSHNSPRKMLQMSHIEREEEPALRNNSDSAEFMTYSDHPVRCHTPSPRSRSSSSSSNNGLDRFPDYEAVASPKNMDEKSAINLGEHAETAFVPVQSGSAFNAVEHITAARAIIPTVSQISTQTNTSQTSSTDAFTTMTPIASMTNAKRNDSNVNMAPAMVTSHGVTVSTSTTPSLGTRAPLGSKPTGGYIRSFNAATVPTTAMTSMMSEAATAPGTKKYLAPGVENLGDLNTFVQKLPLSPEVAMTPTNPSKFMPTFHVSTAETPSTAATAMVETADAIMPRDVGVSVTKPCMRRRDPSKTQTSVSITIPAFTPVAVPIKQSIVIDRSKETQPSIPLPATAQPAKVEASTAAEAVPVIDHAHAQKTKPMTSSYYQQATFASANRVASSTRSNVKHNAPEMPLSQNSAAANTKSRINDAIHKTISTKTRTSNQYNKRNTRTYDDTVFEITPDSSFEEATASAPGKAVNNKRVMGNVAGYWSNSERFGDSPPNGYTPGRSLKQSSMQTQVPRRNAKIAGAGLRVTPTHVRPGVRVVDSLQHDQQLDEDSDEAERSLDALMHGLMEKEKDTYYRPAPATASEQNTFSATYPEESASPITNTHNRNLVGYSLSDENTTNNRSSYNNSTIEWGVPDPEYDGGSMIVTPSVDEQGYHNAITYADLQDKQEVLNTEDLTSTAFDFSPMDASSTAMEALSFRIKDTERTDAAIAFSSGGRSSPRTTSFSTLPTFVYAEDDIATDESPSYHRNYKHDSVNNDGSTNAVADSLMISPIKHVYAMQRNNNQAKEEVFFTQQTTHTTTTTTTAIGSTKHNWESAEMLDQSMLTCATTLSVASADTFADMNEEDQEHEGLVGEKTMDSLYPNPRLVFASRKAIKTHPTTHGPQEQNAKSNANASIVSVAVGDDMKEIVLTCAPGSFTTLVLSFSNKRPHKMVLKSKAILVRYEPFGYIPGMNKYSMLGAGSKTDALQLSTSGLDADMTASSNMGLPPGTIFQVSPATLRIPEGGTSSLYITFSPVSTFNHMPVSLSGQTGGIYSGALKLKSKGKSFVVLLRGIAQAPNVNPSSNITPAPIINTEMPKPPTNTKIVSATVTTAQMPSVMEFIDPSLSPLHRIRSHLQYQKIRDQQEQLQQMQNIQRSALVSTKVPVIVPTSAQQELMSTPQKPASSRASTESLSPYEKIAYKPSKLLYNTTSEMGPAAINTSFSVAASTIKTLRSQQKSYAVQKLLESSQTIAKSMQVLGHSPMKSSIWSGLTATPVAADQIGRTQRLAVTTTTTASTVTSTTTSAIPTDASHALINNNAHALSQGIYFSERIAEFGCVPVGQLCRHQVELCNPTQTPVHVLLSDPILPFVLLHPKVTVQAGAYVSIPIRFVPILPGKEYSCELVAVLDPNNRQAESGPMTAAPTVARIILHGSAQLLTIGDQKQSTAQSGTFVL